MKLIPVISFSTVQIYKISYIHLYYSPSMGTLWTHTLARWLDSSVGSALHQYCRVHWVESHSGQIFLGFNFTTAQVVWTTAMINHIFIFWRKVSKTCSHTNANGRHGGLMVSVLESRASGQGSSSGWGHWVLFLGKTLLSRCLSPPRCINGYRWI